MMTFRSILIPMTLALSAAPALAQSPAALSTAALATATTDVADAGPGIHPADMAHLLSLSLAQPAPVQHAFTGPKPPAGLGRHPALLVQDSLAGR